ncbi:MAG: hypothetical protein V7K90_27720 [Nostoc sp.]
MSLGYSSNMIENQTRTSLEVGIKQANSGELHDLGSFTQYADLEIDE